MRTARELRQRPPACAKRAERSEPPVAAGPPPGTLATAGMPPSSLRSRPMPVRPPFTVVLIALFATALTMGRASAATQATSSTTTITSNINPSTYGQQVTFTATVSPSSPLPTGGVQFFDGANLVFSTSLNPSRQAIWNTTTLTGGSH